ncbi:MAG: DCC1-like thiol-disulfide oxidoreductase family protein, partial [Rothia sp. (in: high G+C Gram-positive bacteria)]|nr:DCC1-like thiol-disulfide oxidoreductase family protein [Rothia sp. (in: high G+C Gram-positive bacteria)]
MPDHGTLFYDPDCGICQKAAGWLGRAGLKASIVPGEFETLQDAGVQLERFMRQIPFRTAQGQLAYGALALGLALRTSCYAPVRWAGGVLVNPVVRPLAERAYRLVAENRSTA